MALRAFKTLRAGLESVRGTNLAPTRGIPYSDGTHSQIVETIYPEELRNSYAGHYLGDAGTETNSLEVGGNLSYNMAVWLGNLYASAEPSGAGGGADKTYTFLPTLTADDLKTATLQYGWTDAIDATHPAWELGYCAGDELTLSWDKSPGNPGVTWRGRFLSPEAAVQISAFTGTGTYTWADAGSLVKANNTSISVDTTTIGTTPDLNIISVEWTLNNGFQNLYTLNNTTAAQLTARPSPFMWTARIRRYYGNDTENDAYVAKTLRKVRITSTGASLGGSNYRTQLDLYGKWTDRTESEVDGFGVEEYTLSDIYDATATGSYQLIVVSDLAAIT